MITSECYHRTLRIQYRANVGTAFIADIDGEEWVVTAKHLVEGMTPNDKLGVWQDGGWKELELSAVVFGVDGEDIALLSPEVPMASPEMRVPFQTAGMVYASDCYLLGYPYEPIDDRGMNRGLGLPFVTKGCISAYDLDKHLLFADITNNYGFSGGPLIVPTGVAKPRFQCIGIVQGQVMQEEGGSVRVNGQEVPFDYDVPVGLSVAIAADAAIKAVKRQSNDTGSI